MTIRKSIEENAIVYVLVISIGSFGLGWGANYSVQQAAGRTTVTVERAKLIDDIENEKKIFNSKIASLEAQKFELETRLAKNSSAVFSKNQNGNKDTMASSELTAKQTEKSAELKQDEWPLIISKVDISAPEGLYINKKIFVKFTQILKPGNTIQIWAYPENDFSDLSYQPSNDLTESGSISRYFIVKRAGIIRKISIFVKHGDRFGKFQDVPVNLNIKE